MDSLLEYLRSEKNAIVRQWLERSMLGSADGVLRRQENRFENPVGATFSETYPLLFDALLTGMEPLQCAPLLDPILRFQAVYCFDRVEAVAFVSGLAEILRREIARSGCPDPDDGTFLLLASRIAAIADVASDLYAKCREQLLEIRRKEAARRFFVRDKVAVKRAAHAGGAS